MTKPTRMAKQRPSNSNLKHRRLTRRSVLLKMLELMSTTSDEDGSDNVRDFLTTGRVGRRNALPDILSDHALTNTADLPDKLMQLTTNDCGETSSASRNENTSSGTTAEPGETSESS